MKKFLAVALLYLLALSGAEAACSAGALPFNLQNNTVADATQVMANFNQIVNSVATNCAGNGANTDITSIGGLTTPLAPSEGGTWIWVGGTSTGSANAQVVASVTPNSNFTLQQGKCVQFIAGFTNTGAMTLNVFGTGVTNVFVQSPAGPQAMIGGEVVANHQELVCYDGTRYELYTPNFANGGNGPLTNLASAATTDLGTIASHNVNITGVTTITSFGSTATATFPLYRLTFAGALTLTNNNTSLILPGGLNILTAANDTAFALYLGSGNWQIFGYTKATGLPVVSAPIPGFLFDCVLSGGGSTVLTLGNSGCRSTSDDFTTGMVISSQYTKSFSNFAVGSGNGALDTGTIATNTWYHVYQIERTDTGVVDYLFSLQPVAGGGGSPTMPANYTKKRRIGSIKTDATPNIIPFVQNSDTFIWSGTAAGTLPGLDINTTCSSTAASVTVNVPVGVRTEGIFNGDGVTTAAVTDAWLLTSLDASDTTVSNTASPLGSFVWTQNTWVGAQVRVWSNLSAQIRHRCNNTDAASVIRLQPVGWVDIRGKF